jgi:MarR family transcriptional regulator, organic hydroperoxide resistance regulator
MEIKQTISFSLSNISVTYRNLLESLMDEIGLHGSQVYVLNELWVTDGQSQADIMKSLGVSAPTITKMISSLVSSSFIQTKKCQNDARITRVYLTKKGKVIQPLVLSQWGKLEEIALKDFNDTEKVLLPLLLEKLKNNFLR